MEETSQAKYSAARSSFQDGSIWNASTDELRRYSEGLATTLNSNDNIKNADIVKALTINHLQTHRVIEALNDSNKASTRLANRLAILSTAIALASLVVAIIGYLRPLRSQSPDLLPESPAQIQKKETTTEQGG